MCRYMRDGNDNLHTRIYVTLEESIVGFNMSIPHVSGKFVNVVRDGITMDGQVIKIPGKGMPKKGAPQTFGDLLVQVKTRYPNKILSKEAITHVQAAFRKIHSWIHMDSPNAIHTVTP